jgi:molybdate transport system substrate-binding protein
MLPMKKLLPWMMFLAFAMPLHAEEFTVAAASDLTAPLKEIARSYEKTSGNKVHLIFGSSGNLFAQIENGAPFDVFLSADADYPRKLIASGKAQKLEVQYASGKIVLWVRFDSPFAKKLTLDALRSPEIKRVAIANPQHAPYGRAAMAAFEKLGLKAAVEPKFVMGENIAQTAQFVLSGNADAGVIALSVALSSPMKERGSFIEFPAASYSRLQQVGVATSKANASARGFLLYLLQADSQAILTRYGFEVPAVKVESKPR